MGFDFELFGFLFFKKWKKLVCGVGLCCHILTIRRLESLISSAKLKNHLLDPVVVKLGEPFICFTLCLTSCMPRPFNFLPNVTCSCCSPQLAVFPHFYPLTCICLPCFVPRTDPLLFSPSLTFQTPVFSLFPLI